MVGGRGGGRDAGREESLNYLYPVAIHSPSWPGPVHCMTEHTLGNPSS